jgi:hypothetical protein
MKAPRAHIFAYVPLARAIHRFGLGHEFHDAVDGLRGMTRIGDRDIERIAHEIDRRQRHAEIDGKGRNNRRFCTEEQALAAGWRKAGT